VSNLSEGAKKRLHDQLIKLGDMMGDGLHHESDGKWISREYTKTLRALGMMPKKNNDVLNKRMSERTESVSCGKCQGQLKQTRSGSKRAICDGCGAKWQLLK
jgi:hypothetical protein